MNYNTHTLNNGLRIIHRPSVGDVLYCGYALKVGTRNERPDEEGLAHFCEHASFKGTERRKASQVIQTLECVGGELNAYTNKESTVYYAAIQRKHLNRTIDLLTDMVFHSTYPEHELEKEKEVVCDEIESYNDSPAELIYDEFENIVFSGHPLGHNILGTSERVRMFTSDDARRFTARYYRPDNAIFFIYGDVDFQRLIAKLKKMHATVSTATTATDPAPEAKLTTSEATVKVSEATVKASEATIPDVSTSGSSQPGTTPTIRNLGTHQAHVLIGRRAYDVHNSKRIALYLLNNILGGPAMSSRLNMALRERNGLVYTVESSMVAYEDTGLWTVYFGCDSHDVNRCIRLVRRELNKLMQKPLSERQLKQAKDQLKGQIALACDSRESFALDFAKSFLHYGWQKDISSLCNNIDQLTSQDLQLVAQEIFEESNITKLIYK